MVSAKTGLPSGANQPPQKQIAPDVLGSGEMPGKATIDTDTCTTAIVEWCKANRDEVSQHLMAPLTSTEQDRIEDHTNWDEISTRTTHGGVLREFCCLLYHGQLRALVLSNKDDTAIISLIVLGE